MSKEIIKYHFSKVINFFIISLILFFLLSIILIVNTDIVNQSYISTLTQKSIPKHYIITDRDGNMYSIDMKEKSLLNRDFIVHSKVQFENIQEKNYEFSIFEYFKNLFDYKLLNSYSQEIKNTNFMLRYLGAIVLFLYLLYNYIKNIKYNLIPLHFNIYNIIGIEPKQKKIYDKFVKTNDNQIIYKNSSKINYDIYVKELENIKQYLNLKDDNLEVERYKDKSISLVITQLPKLVEFDKSKLQKGKIYLGVNKYKQDFYIDIKDMTHFITVATTGAGKSVYTQNLLLSLFFNHNQIDKFYLIDPKRAEFGRYKKLKKVHYSSSEEEILNTVKQLQEIMYKRYDEMESDSLDSGDILYNGNYIFMVMDEFGTLGTISNKDIKKEVERILIDLAQKARRAKIKMIFIGQKALTSSISSSILTNLASRGVMLTDDTDNINKMVGSSEELKERGINPKKFPKGRLYFKNGDNGENTLVQVPFFNLQDIKHLEVLKEVVQDLIVEELTGTVQSLNYDVEIKTLWDRTKQLEDATLASQIRTEIQKVKRAIKANNLSNIENEINHIKNLFK